MDAAHQLQPPPEDKPAGVLAAVQPEPTAEAAQPEPQARHEAPEHAHEGPKLAAVPPPAGQVKEAEHPAEEPLPERAPKATRESEELPERAPVAMRKARHSKAESRAEQTGSAKEGPSRDQIRRYRERWEAAKTPEQKAAALRFGLDRGVPEALETAEALRLVQGQPAPTPAPPPPAQQPAGPETATAAPPAGATATATAAPAPPQPPAEPMLMGHPRKAMLAAGEQALFIANLCEGLGKMVGWSAQPVEPMTLFDDLPGVEPLQVTGNPKKQLVELAARELADLTRKTGGAEDSPFKRRVQIGVLVVGMAGPGLVPLVAGAAGRALGMLKGASQAISGQVRRWRRG